MARRRRSSDAAMQAAALTILVTLTVGIINLLFFSKSKFAKTVRPFAWTFVLAVGLWCWRETTRPEFYECEACGLEYTCEDEEGREPHGYCEKTATHKHHGSLVKRYDLSRGVLQTGEWILGGAKGIQQAITTEGEESAGETTSGK